MKWQYFPDEIKQWSTERYAEFWAYQRILSERYEGDSDSMFSFVTPILRHL
jgi:hypothetical protein